MKYIGLFNVDDYADNGGGLQDPVVLQATTMEEAKKEAVTLIKKEGLKDENYHSVSEFRIYGVVEEQNIDIEALNAQARLEAEEKKQNKAKQQEINSMLKLIQKYPEEAKQIVVDNEK